MNTNGARLRGLIAQGEGIDCEFKTCIELLLVNPRGVARSPLRRARKGEPGYRATLAGRLA